MQILMSPVRPGLDKAMLIRYMLSLRAHLTGWRMWERNHLTKLEIGPLWSSPENLSPLFRIIAMPPMTS